MDLLRLRQERPDILLSSDERELVAAFDEPDDDIRDAFVNTIPHLLTIYAKKRRAIAEGNESLWQEVLRDEMELVGGMV